MQQYKEDLEKRSEVVVAKETHLREMVYRLSDMVHEIAKDFGREQKLMKEQIVMVMERLGEMAIRNNEDIRFTNERIDDKMGSLFPHVFGGTNEGKISDVFKTLLAQNSRRRRSINETEDLFINMTYPTLPPMHRYDINGSDFNPLVRTEDLMLKIWTPIMLLFLITWFCIWRIYTKMTERKGRSFLHRYLR